MTQSNILVRLSGRKREHHIPTSNGNTKGSAPDISWRRRSLTSLRRRLSPGVKPVSSPTKAVGRDLNATFGPVHVTNGKESNSREVLINNDATELPTPYSKPVELIRQEEYPPMNQGLSRSHPISLQPPIPLYPSLSPLPPTLLSLTSYQPPLKHPTQPTLLSPTTSTPLPPIIPTTH